MKTRFFYPFILATAVAAQVVAAAEFHVAAQGSDDNPGTLAKPFATLQRAQLAARKQRSEDRGEKAVTVFVREGTYNLAEPLVFSCEDSGSKAVPVIYQAYGNERSVLSGGMLLRNLTWQPYKDGILMAKVPEGLTTDQLFVNGSLQILARYPNFDPKARVFHGCAADAFSPQRAAKWLDPTGGFIHTLHGNGWGGMHYRITGKGPDNNVTYEGGWQNNRPSGMNKSARFVENIFEELNAPGEWFLDTKKNLLYFYPPAGLDLAQATVETVRLRNLVEFRGSEQQPVGWITFKGLKFRHSARTFMDTKEPVLRSDWAIYRGGAVLFNGAEDCLLENCLLDQLGGNAVFINNYNRRITVRGCHITRAGGNGVAFIGDPNACYNGVTWAMGNDLDKIDRAAGPKTSNYPGDCVVEDCLIHDIGQVEKQTAGVTMDMAQGITIRHCSIYDVPRAGINIGDGCWGGHLIDFCDVFDTVKETGDHGSFNSWGRDRYWNLRGLNLNDDKAWEANKELVTVDACKTTIIRNSRWRCNNGWDIDLDDGSTNYHIYNNLCLHGGLKNREGFGRVVENNILFGGFHPHVWYKYGGEIFRHNIMSDDKYHPAGDIPAPWGQDVDNNLVHRAGLTTSEPATILAGQSKRDVHSLVADAMFVDAANGDFRVSKDSPALKLGFVNFPMDQFGVQLPTLKALARTPEMPAAVKSAVKSAPTPAAPSVIWQAWVRDISGLGDRSVYGLPDETGVLVMDVPATSLAAKAGLQKDDVIVACDGNPVCSVDELKKYAAAAAEKKFPLTIIRKQKQMTVAVQVPQ